MVDREQPENAEDRRDWQPAPLLRRFGALFIDWILCVLISSLFADLRTVAWPPVAILILGYGLFIGVFAQTPGMWVTRLRCVSFTNGRAIGVPRALGRGILLSIVIPALIMDRDGRGLHDRIVGSVVVGPIARG